MFGYNGKIALLDLTNEKTKTEEISETFCKKFLGGNGFGIKLLYDYAKPRIDPLSPDNVMVFALGPFLGTPIPTGGKYIVHAKSPLTGFQGESVSSSFWAPALKMAGYDALIIMGRAKKPSYLFIDDDIIELRDARWLWGKDCVETSDMIREKMGDDNVRVASIGQAGEHLVRFASIYNDTRSAGRTGMGAVMGSKQIKAIAVRGTKTLNIAKPDELLESCQEYIKKCRSNLTTSTYRNVGTIGSLVLMNDIGGLPIKNYQRSVLEGKEFPTGDIRNITPDYMTEHYINKAVACAGCPIACDHIYFVREEPYKNTNLGVDFETVYSLGSDCGIRYFPPIAKANELCDRLGIDTISAGVTIAWAMECYEKGIFTLNDTDGIELTFGNYEALLKIIPKIAYREGIGSLLAEGVKQASEKVGKGSEYYAIHSKGLEFPGYDVRGLKATALAFAVSTRGACHLRARAYWHEVRGIINRFTVEKGRGGFVAEQENLLTLFDSLMLCKFSQGIWEKPYEEFAQLYTLVTGIKINPDEMRTAGERIWNLEKAYNLREGWTRKDDYLPPRILKDPIPDGFAKGHYVSEDEFNFMLDDYYAARGWTKEGIPTKQTLNQLGLNDVSEKWGV